MWWLSWFVNSAWSSSLRGWESSSVRQTLAVFQRWCWGLFQELGWHTCGLSKHADTILNWTEANCNWFCGLPLTTALFWPETGCERGPTFQSAHAWCSLWWLQCVMQQLDCPMGKGRVVTFVNCWRTRSSWPLASLTLRYVPCSLFFHF